MTWFGQASTLETGTSWAISTAEVGRIAIALAAFVVLLALNWLATARPPETLGRSIAALLA